MEVTFTKTSDRTCSQRVVRDDGASFEMPHLHCNGSLPHDMVHFIVERELGLNRGFWGSVAAGAVFSGMNMVVGKKPPHAEARSKAILHEIAKTGSGTDAECIAAKLFTLMQKKLEGDWQAARSILAATWRPNKPSRGPLTPEELRRVCEELREAERQWGTLALHQSMILNWPTKKIERETARPVAAFGDSWVSSR